MRTASTESLTNVLAEVCEQFHIHRLRLFGSAVRDEMNDNSDVDLLVEYDEGYPRDLNTLENLESRLQEIFGGRKIDLVRPHLLHWFIRDAVLSTARTLYER